MELATDDTAAAQFVSGIIPTGMAQAAATETVSLPPPPAQNPVL